MGKSFKRVFALCLAAVMMIASSMAVLAAPTSPSEGGKTVEPVITKQSSTTNTSKGTVKVFYKHKNSEQFVIQYKLRKSSWSKATKKTTTNSNLLLTDLTKKGGLYDIRIAGVKKNTQGKWSTVIRRLMNQTKATATSKNGVLTVKLPKTAGATGYQIKYATKSDFSDAKTVGQKATSGRRVIKGLKKGTTYYVRVTPFAKTSGAVYWGQMYTFKVTVK